MPADSARQLPAERVALGRPLRERSDYLLLAYARWLLILRWLLNASLCLIGTPVRVALGRPLEEAQDSGLEELQGLGSRVEGGGLRVEG